MNKNIEKIDSNEIIEDSNPATLDDIVESYQREYIKSQDESLSIDKE